MTTAPIVTPNTTPITPPIGPHILLTPRYTSTIASRAFRELSEHVWHEGRQYLFSDVKHFIRVRHANFYHSIDSMRCGVIFAIVFGPISSLVISYG
ncbi:hypothetical protein ABZ942_13380 [Nocardia sp. NPDC046473]|uniref:hypothetical protein n=1 Tax=Nocardia sp. NPDC046473 TaxID=3155733 RepID=UPI0033D0B73B